MFNFSTRLVRINQGSIISYETIVTPDFGMYVFSLTLATNRTLLDYAYMEYSYTQTALEWYFDYGIRMSFFSNSVNFEESSANPFAQLNQSRTEYFWLAFG